MVEFKILLNILNSTLRMDDRLRWLGKTPVWHIPTSKLQCRSRQMRFVVKILTMCGDRFLETR